MTQCERKAHELDRRTVELSPCWGLWRGSEGHGRFPIRASRMGTSKLRARPLLAGGTVRPIIYLSDFMARSPATYQLANPGEVISDLVWVVFDPETSRRARGRLTGTNFRDRPIRAKTILRPAQKERPAR